MAALEEQVLLVQEERDACFAEFSEFFQSKKHISVPTSANFKTFFPGKRALASPFDFAINIHL